MPTPDVSETLDATLVVKCGYRGARFSGYAEQEGQRTVAGELRRALETLFRREVDLTCAGRTDAGVSAIAQYVSLPVTFGELASRSPQRLWRKRPSACPAPCEICCAIASSSCLVCGETTSCSHCPEDCCGATGGAPAPHCGGKGYGGCCGGGWNP